MNSVFPQQVWMLTYYNVIAARGQMGGAVMNFGDNCSTFDAGQCAEAHTLCSQLCPTTAVRTGARPDSPGHNDAGRVGAWQPAYAGHLARGTRPTGGFFTPPLLSCPVTRGLQRVANHCIRGCVTVSRKCFRPSNLWMQNPVPAGHARRAALRGRRVAAGSLRLRS